MWTWKLSSDFYKLPSWCRKCWSYRYLRRAMRECQVCSSFVIEFKARSSKHYFNCGQPVVGDTRASRYHFFLRTCRSWMEDIARCFYAPRHPIHARWIKVKWDFLFGNYIAIGVQLVVCKMEKKNQSIFFSFFAVKKFFFKVIFLYFAFTTRPSRNVMNVTFSLTFIVYFSTVLNIHGTLHWNSTSEWWASRYVIASNAKLQEEGRRATIWSIPLSFSC